MKTIQTRPDCVLQFIACPRGYEKTVYTYPEGADPLRWKPIGRLSEITEDQAKELTPQLSVFIPKEMRTGIDEWKEYTGKELIKMAALSVGIEEKDFDKYLVVKL